MPDFTVAISLLKKPIEDLYSLATGALKQQIAVISAQSKVKGLHKRIWESQRVKTIWHTDKPISLSSFFYPVSIKSQEKSKLTDKVYPIKITSLKNLPNKHTIIFGTVGQGKSILLRYLLGQELRSGAHIPLLCELRNIESQSLISYLNERFALLLDIPPNQELFSFFATHGKIAFLLDGFDEINNEKIPKISQELEDLANKYNVCHIVLTSRPDTECRYLTSFHTVRIQGLTPSDLEPFYKQIGHDANFAKLIVSSINRSPVKIRELISTPLLATLLAISYRAAHKIPIEFSEFYEELFQILLIRHDASKLGWQRSRKTKLNAREIQQVFEAFCFATRKRNLVVIDFDEAVALSKACLNDVGLSSDAQHIIEDIKRVTCLLVEEGKKLQFVHSSVQEFFAARYVKTRTEQVAASFYKQLLDKIRWSNWQQELMFLKQIDSYRATKYFFTHDLKKTIQFLLEDNALSPSTAAIKYLEGMSVMKVTEKKNEIVSTKFQIHKIRKFTLTYHLQLIDNIVFNSLFSSIGWKNGFNNEETVMQRSYLQIAKDHGGSKLPDILELVSSMIIAQQTELKNFQTMITNEESTSGLIDLTV
jgi:predicted NACHT family NTPase